MPRNFSLIFIAIVLYSGLDKNLILQSGLFWENKKLNEIPVLSLITVLLFKNPDVSNALFKLLCEYFSSPVTSFSWVCFQLSFIVFSLEFLAEYHSYLPSPYSSIVSLTPALCFVHHTVCGLYVQPLKRLTCE